MFSFIWSLLNVALGVYILYLCFWAAKFLRQKFGVFATLIFLFALFSRNINISTGNKNKYQDSLASKIIKMNFTGIDKVNKNTINRVTVILNESMINKYKLTITYGQDNESKENVPIDASSFVSGLATAVYWKPYLVSVQKSSSNKFEYSVEGMIEWKLLNSTIYDYYEKYSGIVELN